MEFDARETATVLAALRMLQRKPVKDREGLPHFVETTPLSNEEIDDLCERINIIRNPDTIQLSNAENDKSGGESAWTVSLTLQVTAQSAREAIHNFLYDTIDRDINGSYWFSVVRHRD